MKTLHTLKKTRLVQPRFGSLFRCLGEACPEDCCTGWSVDVDKTTYDAYKRTSTRQLKAKFDSSVYRKQNETTNHSYGLIGKNDSTNSCCFLENRLCSIQKSLGSARLSHTCFNFPRAHRRIDQEIERSFTLACPEIARLALLDKHAYEFEELEDTIRIATVSSLNSEGQINRTLANELRIFALSLLKGYTGPTWEKLAILGVVCEAFSQAYRRGTLSPDSGRSILLTIQSLIQQGKIGGELSLAAPQPNLQAEAFSLILKAVPIKAYTELAQKRMNNALEGLQFDLSGGENNVDTLATRYQQGLARLALTLKNTPWFFDHYVISDLLWNAFPFNREDPYASYIGIVTRFGLVRLLLAGSCMHNPDISENELAQVVQTFVRHYQHNRLFASTVDGCLERSGWDALNKVFLFLRAD